MAKRKTIQENAVDTLLQRPEEVIINGKKYIVAKPNLATIYSMRAILSRIKVEKTDDAFVDLLRNIDNKDVMADLLTELIVGERERESLVDRYYHRKSVALKRELRSKILYHMEPKDIAHYVCELINTEQLHDFFVFTASLAEMSQPQNGKAVKKTSGQ